MVDTVAETCPKALPDQMKRKIMEFAVFWLVIIGPILIGLAGAIWYGGGKTPALWAGFTGTVLLLLAAALQIQQTIGKSQPPQPSATTATSTPDTLSQSTSPPVTLPQHPQETANQVPVAWNLDSQFLVVTGGGPEARINSVLLQGTSTALVTMKEAYAVSGLTGHKQELFANVQYQGYYPVDKVDIPPEARVWLELIFKPPLSITEFINQWEKFSVTVVYHDATNYHHEFDANYIRQKLQQMIPDAFGPRVTPRPD